MFLSETSFSPAEPEPDRRATFVPGQVLNEAALVALDEAARSSSFNVDLLSTTPARDIRAQIEAAVTLLEKLDYGALLSKQGPISRITGADVEARLEFELAGQRVILAMQQLRQAADNGRRITKLLKEALVELAHEQIRLDAVIADAKQLRDATANDADEFVRARFERRLSNIMAMYAANAVTAEQMRLAENVLASLLDRVTDVDTVLLPLWQRNMLALAHADAGKTQKRAADEFAAAHTQLIIYLKRDKSP